MSQMLKRFCVLVYLIGVCIISQAACTVPVTGPSSSGINGGPGANIENQEVEASDDVYEIYLLLIDTEKSVVGNPLFVEIKTVFGNVKPNSTLRDVIDVLRAVDSRILNAEMIAKYGEVNGRSRTLRLNEFEPLLANHTLVLVESGEPLPPGTTRVKFSQVAFNSERNRALVYFEFYSGPKTGGGFFVTLSKDNDRWTKEEEFPIFAS